MLKKFLIIVLVLLVIASVGAAVAGYNLNESYGWWAAATINHEDLATPDTRLRVAVDTLRLGNDLQVYLPPEVALPGWLPWDLPHLLPKVLPREVAVLGGTDFRDGVFGLTLFLNEQRGGPFLPEFLNSQSGFKEATPAIEWDKEGFTLAERGKLTAKGHLPLPDGLESTILESWPAEAPSDPLLLLGGHMIEGVLDNRNGDIVTLIAACAPIWGTSLDQLKANPQFTAALELLVQIHNVRLAVDFKDKDTVVLQLLINAAPEIRGRLEFMGPFALPMVSTELKRTYGLDSKSGTSWLTEESTYKIEFIVLGVEAKLKESFRGLAPVTAKPATAEDMKKIPTR